MTCPFPLVGGLSERPWLVCAISQPLALSNTKTIVLVIEGHSVRVHSMVLVPSDVAGARATIFRLRGVPSLLNNSQGNRRQPAEMTVQQSDILFSICGLRTAFH